MFKAASDETRRERLKTIGHQLRLAPQLAHDSGPGYDGGAVRRGATPSRPPPLWVNTSPTGATVEPLVRAAAVKFGRS
jgi:hypothetical protein